jgi:hypothetical protein
MITKLLDVYWMLALFRKERAHNSRLDSSKNSQIHIKTDLKTQNLDNKLTTSWRNHSNQKPPKKIKKIAPISRIRLTLANGRNFRKTKINRQSWEIWINPLPRWTLPCRSTKYCETDEQKKHPKRSAPREIKNTTKKKSRIRDNLESGLSRSGEKRWSREEIQRRPVVAPSLLQFRQWKWH